MFLDFKINFMINKTDRDFIINDSLISNIYIERL